MKFKWDQVIINRLNISDVVVTDEFSDAFEDVVTARRGRFRVTEPSSGAPETTTLGRFRLVPQSK